MGCLKLSTFETMEALCYPPIFSISPLEPKTDERKNRFNYSAFGMTMPLRSTNTGSYRYAFNGMEVDNEVKGNGNSYTTEFRQYDPRLGRWLSLDPLASKYPGMSPYVAFNNNPIYYTDPLGLEGEPNKDGRGSGFERADGSFKGTRGLNEITVKAPRNKDGSLMKPKKSSSWTYIPPQKLLGSNYKPNSGCKSPQYSGKCFANAPSFTGSFKEPEIPKYITVPGTEVEIEDEDNSYAAVVAASVLRGRGIPPIVIGVLVVSSVVYLDNYRPPVIMSEITLNLDFLEAKDYEDAVTKEIPPGMVPIFRGIASDDIRGVNNPAYPPSVNGVAVPQGGPAGPYDANHGAPSNYTFWSTNPMTAYNFAIRGKSGYGTIIMKLVPWGELYPNSSPDHYQEGEVQLYGTQQGTPTPVRRK